MRTALLVVSILGCLACSKTKPKSETMDKGSSVPTERGSGSAGVLVPSRNAVSIAKPAPQGPYALVMRCSHSMEPWGTGFWSSTVRIDLETGIATGDRQDSENQPYEQGKPRPMQKPMVTTASPPTKLDAERIGKLRAAFEEVLQGGPYEQELALSESITCSLDIEAAGKSFFTIDKSRSELDDAVNRLVGLM